MQVLKEEGLPLDFNMDQLRLLNSMKFTLDFGPFGLHFGVFIPTIEFLGSDDQVKKYVQDAKDLKIIGAYSQTELSHGSDVQSL